MRSAVRRDRGVTIIEAAFGLPVFLLFVFGLVDLGMWSMNSNQATNAARDGARVGILAYEEADRAGADRDAIVAAVLEHLPAGTAEESDVTVECVDPEGEPLAWCADALPEVDSIRVEVRWDWGLVTPIAGAVGTDRGAATGSATMRIVGLPREPGGEPSPSTTSTTTSTTTTTPQSTTTTTTSPPSTTTTTTAPCSASVDVDPEVVELRSSDKPQGSVTFTITTDGAGCSGLMAQMELPDGRAFDRSLSTSGEAEHVWTIGKNEISGWTDGIATVRVFRGSSAIGSTTFSVR